MRKLITVIAMVCIIAGPLLSRREPVQTREGNPDDLTGVFVLQGDSTLRVSIDSGWERNGWVPVFLAFDHLEFCLRVKAENLSHAYGLETEISRMLSEDMNLPFLTYEQNALRTRMKLLDTGQPIQLAINRGTGLAEVLIGDSRLNIEPVHVNFDEIRQGELYELTFTGPDVFTFNRFVLAQSEGVIYAVFRFDTFDRFALAPNSNKEWSVWAVKIEPGEGSVLDRGEKK